MNARYVICQLIRLFFFHVSESNGIGRMRNVSCFGAAQMEMDGQTDGQTGKQGWVDSQVEEGRWGGKWEKRQTKQVHQ